jgi:hypothetical protein
MTLSTDRGALHFAFIVDVGYDNESARDFKLEVGLSPLGGGELEFYFYLWAVDGQTGEITPYWCGRDVAQFVSRENRAEIRAVLMTLTRDLLETARPGTVHYVTHDANPPDEAMLKHEAIIKVFEDCSYEVHTADPWHGKRVWWMERAEK